MPVPVGRILTDIAVEDPDRPLVTCGEDTATRGELESRSNRLARAYAAHGVKQGDFVTIALPNSVEFFAAAFAAWKLGAVPQPVSNRLPARELQAIIELADPALVVGVPEGAEAGRPCVSAGYEPDPSISDAPIEPVLVPPAWKAPTSGGSTGRPKLIVSGAPGEMEPQAGTGYGMKPNGVQLVPGPLYHNAPFSFSMVGIYAGVHAVVLPKFDAEAALDAIDAHGVDWVNLVPTMMQRMLRLIQKHPGRWRLDSLQTVWHMAAPCPEWVKEAWIELIGGDKLYEMYGGTEGVSFTVITGTEWLEHRGSVGRPAYGEMRILGPEGEELPANEVGEIFMRSPAGAAASYRYVGADPRARDGWESIGDLGWMDADGYLYISDRRTDMIVAGGANVYPAEVEAALSEHPAVDTCVVVGLPDDDLGKRVHAVVQTSEPVSDDELRDFLAERLVRYKIPRSFRFVDEPLRGDDGKVRRSEIQEQEAALMAAAGTVQ